MTTYDPNNPFARILRGELPSTNVHEDTATLAFMDLMPQAEGHTLVIPKTPAVELMELDSKSATALMLSVQAVARAVKTAFSAPGVIIAQLNGPAAGQTVFHVHFHVVPAWPGTTLSVHGGKQAERSDLERTAAKIRAVFEPPTSTG